MAHTKIKRKITNKDFAAQRDAMFRISQLAKQIKTAEEFEEIIAQANPKFRPQVYEQIKFYLKFCPRFR